MKLKDLFLFGAFCLFTSLTASAQTVISPGVSSLGSTGQMMQSQGPSTLSIFHDFTDITRYPAANCVNGAPGGGWSTDSTFTPACINGTNWKGGVYKAKPSDGATAYFEYELPADWSTSNNPFMAMWYDSGSNTSGTVIWTISSACTKGDGSVTSDPAWIAESAMATQTMTATGRMWEVDAQLAGAMTNCIGKGTLFVRAVLSGTASSQINAYKAIIATPRRPVVEAQ